jgi:hypothetical protein
MSQKFVAEIIDKPRASFTLPSAAAAPRPAAITGATMNTLIVNRTDIGRIARAAAGIIAAMAGVAAAQPCTPEWSPLSTGMVMEPQDPSPATVATLAVYDDGNGPALYAGGIFTVAGGVSASKVAKWTGQAWEPVGGGMEYNSIVLKLEPFNGDLYAAGTFTIAGGQPANRVARWDGQQWLPLAGGTSGQANALAVFDDGTGPALYVGGTFTAADGAPASRIAKWDGQAWSPLGSGLSSFANVLMTYQGSLYAAGNFTTAGGVPATRIARWDGQSWSAVGNSGLATSQVSALVAFDAGGGAEDLYAGGSFGMLRWDGQAWSTVSGAPGTSALAVFDGTLYSTGGFVTVGGVCMNNIAAWDGQSWSPLANGLYSNGNALAVFDGALYVGGQFLSASGVPGTTRVARWGCP